jgi:RNA polymerase sigma factor (sigma-70 family)
MDYAPLVNAIQEGDQETANRLISDATPILIRMLKVRMNASHEDAEDAVQMMFLYVVNAIREGRIDNPSGLLSYMVMTCRHSYLKKMEGFQPELLDEEIREPTEQPSQLKRLLDEEKQQIYDECIESLRDDYREFYHYWIRHSDSSAREIAEHFGISVNNAWTRKHRIVKTLQKCVDSKF